MRLAGSVIAKSDELVARNHIFAAREFENERLVERGYGGEIECIEALHRRKMRRPDAPFDHSSFPIDELEFGEPQKIAKMIEPFPRRFHGDLIVFTQEVGNLSCRK